MRYLVDSSAWIEYLEGSKSGEKVSNFIDSQNEVYTTSLNIAEVISILARKKAKTETGYAIMIKRAKIIEVTPKIAKEAGKTHAELKKRIENISLTDVIIAKTAESINATVITKDAHFKHLSKAEFI